MKERKSDTVGKGNTIDESKIIKESKTVQAGAYVGQQKNRPPKHKHTGPSCKSCNKMINVKLNFQTCGKGIFDPPGQGCKIQPPNQLFSWQLDQDSGKVDFEGAGYNWDFELQDDGDLKRSDGAVFKRS